MLRLSKAVLLAGVAISLAQEEGRFQAPQAATLRARQTVDRVTIGVEPYETREKMKKAFGKADLSKLGVLPILVVIANDSDQVMQLDRLRVQFITADRQTIDRIPAEDVNRGGPVKRPEVNPRPSPLPLPGRLPGSGKSASKDLESISAREFVAPVAPPHSSANGFFYFRLGKGPDRIPGSKVYLTGIRNAQTGQDILYFEISLDDYRKGR